MTKLALITGLALSLAVGVVSAQNQTTQPATHRAKAQSSQKAAASSEQNGTVSGKQIDVSEGTKIAAELVSSVDAQTAKPGDQVVARVTKSVKEHGQTVIEKGDELVGRITQVNASGAGSAGSSLGIAFDHLVQGNSTSQLNAVINSIVSTPGERRAEQQQMDSEPMLPAGGPIATRGSGSAIGSGRASGGGGGGLLGGVGSTVSSTASGAVSTAGNVAGNAGSSAGSTVGSTVNSATSATGNVAGAATGAVGANSSTALGNTTNAMVATPRHAIHLGTDTQGSQQTGANSVLSTRKGDLRLEQGTQMQFRVAGSADAH